MNTNSGDTFKRKRTALMLVLPIMVIGGAAMAWTLWSKASSQRGPEDRHGALDRATTFAAAASPFAASPSPDPTPLPVVRQVLASAPSSGSTPPKTTVTQQRSSPEIDLATRAHLALQSGSAEEAHKVATYISMCSDFEGVVALAYKLPLEKSPAHQIARDEALKQQRQCQALDAAAKALYEPLLMKAFEGGSHNAARSMAHKRHLLAKFSPEQKARVAQAMRVEATRGDVTSISFLSDASASLGTSLRDDYAYALAFKSIRQEERKDLKYFGAFPKEYFLAWEEELKFKEQQLSKAELEQARQQAEAVLRSYREARMKERDRKSVV